MVEVELTTFLDVSFDILIQSKGDFAVFNESVDVIFGHYEGVFFELFKNPISSNVFDSLVYANCCLMGTWNPMSALLMASTTVIPVGFGFITPLTAVGRIFFVVYAIIGVPLTLIVTSDIGKFVCGFIFSLLDESPMRSMFALMTMLLSYPILMGLAISTFSSMKIVDSLYYSIMCIFTIGYGDILPPISVPILILMIAVGVTLVTVSVELVGSTIIHNVHYMGRQMSRAREIAGRVIKIAQKINVNRGLTIGISQLNAFTRLGMAMDFSHGLNRLSRTDNAYEPEIALDFVDFASTSEIFVGENDP
uniref:Potassium channel domain-containing protein n=1 Tax=Panagrolaimus sp. JU765 TaxID=591449 RepID=A0AC34QHD2_9BILA